MYEITVTRTFTATHALRLHDGSLEPAHAHEWRACVTVGSRSLDSIETVMDFHELERMAKAVTDTADGRHLNDIPPFNDGPLNPSAERVARWIAAEVTPRLPGGVTLLSVAVTEAEGCVATYRPGS